MPRDNSALREMIHALTSHNRDQAVREIVCLHIKTCRTLTLHDLQEIGKLLIQLDRKPAPRKRKKTAKNQ